MSWHTRETAPDVMLILDEKDMTVGSIGLLSDGFWHAEVLWAGANGDIDGKFKEYACALAFVEGVEKTLAIVEAFAAIHL